MQGDYPATDSSPINQIKSTNRACVCLTLAEINVTKAVQFISDPKCGGNSIFLGSSRDLEGDGERQETIESLVYEAYEGMALKEMNKIAQQSLDDQVRHVYIVHRLGCVPVGQHSILIATSSPGRKECSSTTLKILNEIKRFVPIWKKCSLIEASACEDGSTAKWGVKSEAFWLSTDSRKNDSIDERSRFQESK